MLITFTKIIPSMLYLVRRYTVKLAIELVEADFSKDSCASMMKSIHTHPNYTSQKWNRHAYISSKCCIYHYPECILLISTLLVSFEEGMEEGVQEGPPLLNKDELPLPGRFGNE